MFEWNKLKWTWSLIICFQDKYRLSMEKVWVSWVCEKGYMSAFFFFLCLIWKELKHAFITGALAIDLFVLLQFEHLINE